MKLKFIRYSVLIFSLFQFSFSLLCQYQTIKGFKTMKLVKTENSEIENFYMDETPVTYKDFEVYVRAGGLKNAYWYYDSYHISNQAVTGISWFHAIDFCNWRSACEGLEKVYIKTDQVDNWGYPIYKIQKNASGYRLPESDEFIFAAIGNTHFSYPWGNHFIDSLANYDTDRGHKSTLWWRLAPVKSQYKNSFGLYNLCGNNWHWCNDWKTENESKLLAGGSWGAIDSTFLKSTYTSSCSPATYNYDIGFRCVRLAQFVKTDDIQSDTLISYDFYREVKPIGKKEIKDFYSLEFKESLSRFIAVNYPECINFLVKIDQQEIITADQMADLLIKVCKKHKINPLFLASIMVSESGFGTVSFPRWFNSPMAFHWQNKLMDKGLPVYEDLPGKKNRKYATLEIGFEAFCKGIRRELYYKAANKNLDSFHIIYVGYRADEWMKTLSKVYMDVAGIRFEPLFPSNSAGKYIYSDWEQLKLSLK